MPLKSTSQRYGAVTQSFHWGMAVLILLVLGLGFVMEDFPGALRKDAYGLHKSAGVLSLFLAACRLAWIAYSRNPPLPFKGWKKIVSRAEQVLLYIALFALPLSGWGMSSAGGHPVSFFGLFTLPPLAPPGAGPFLREAHEVGGFALAALLALHAGRALKHHFIDRNAALRRMLP